MSRKIQNRSHLRNVPGMTKRNLLAIRGREMTGTHIHLDADGARCGVLHVSEGRGKLGGFPILHSRIVESSGQQARRILSTLAYGLHGTVFHHVLMILLFVGIAC